LALGVRVLWEEEKKVVDEFLIRGLCGWIGPIPRIRKLQYSDAPCENGEMFHNRAHYGPKGVIVKTVKMRGFFEGAQRQGFMCAG